MRYPKIWNTKIILRVFPPKSLDWNMDDRWNIKYPSFEHEQDNLQDITYFIIWNQIYFVCKYIIQD